jgi:hypothetical protein
MSTFMVEDYVVRPEKQGEFTALLQTFLKYKEGHPEVFKGLKSWRLFRREYGGISGSYVELWEFDNKADLDGVVTRIHQDEQFSEFPRAFRLLVDPATHSIEIWSAAV